MDLFLILFAYVFCLILITLLIKSSKKCMIFGSIVGFSAWLYDLDFLFNPGGPEANLHIFICNVFSGQVSGCSPLLSLFILTMLGGVIGNFKSIIKSIINFIKEPFLLKIESEKVICPKCSKKFEKIDLPDLCCRDCGCDVKPWP